MYQKMPSDYLHKRTVLTLVPLRMKRLRIALTALRPMDRTESAPKTASAGMAKGPRVEEILATTSLTNEAMVSDWWGGMGGMGGMFRSSSRNCGRSCVINISFNRTEEYRTEGIILLGAAQRWHMAGSLNANTGPAQVHSVWLLRDSRGH